MNLSAVRNRSTIVLTKDLERAQKSQEVSLRENCILVDQNDQPTGHASKRDCHRVGDNGKLLLHRAFSVFLFNTNGEMLVQRRSSHKVWELVVAYVKLRLFSFKMEFDLKGRLLRSNEYQTNCCDPLI